MNMEYFMYWIQNEVTGDDYNLMVESNFKK